MGWWEVSEDGSKSADCRAALNDDARLRLHRDYAAAPFNAWLQVTDEKAFRAFEGGPLWQPKLNVGHGDGVKFIMFEREDGAGYVLPGEHGWWATWAHPMMGGGPGWHHHAFGTYEQATAAAMAFDTVYELERIAGNVDRCPCLKTENAK